MAMMAEKINNVQIRERIISLVLGKHVKSGASDMAQWGKPFVAKTDYLSSVIGAHTVGENQLLQVDL